MSAGTFIIKRGDTAPAFRARCLDGSAPVDLTSASQVRLLVKRSGSVAVSSVMTVEDQATNPGWVHHTWQVGETSAAGNFRGEVEVTWGDGTVQTFPAEGYAPIRVTDDLG